MTRYDAGFKETGNESIMGCIYPAACAYHTSSGHNAYPVWRT